MYYALNREGLQVLEEFLGVLKTETKGAGRYYCTSDFLLQYINNY